MFIASILVSLRMPGLKEKSLVVITRLVDNGGLIKIYLLSLILVRVLRYLDVQVARKVVTGVFDR